MSRRRGAQWKTVRIDAMHHVKQAIRDELEASGATQADLADYLGISQKHASQMLSGRIDGTAKLLAQMASAVGLRLTVVRESGSPDG